MQILIQIFVYLHFRRFRMRRDDIRKIPHIADGLGVRWIAFLHTIHLGPIGADIGHGFGFAKGAGGEQGGGLVFLYLKGDAVLTRTCPVATFECQAFLHCDFLFQIRVLREVTKTSPTKKSKQAAMISQRYTWRFFKRGFDADGAISFESAPCQWRWRQWVEVKPVD